MKISLITAVYNRHSTLEDSLKSAITQTYSNVEHLIQDGGSTDGSLDVIARHKHDRMQIVSERDCGIYDALNRGVARATGDVVGFLHSDDMLAHNNVLTRVIDAFSDPSVDGVYGDLEYVASNDTTRIIRSWRSGIYTPKQLKWGWMPPHPTLFLRRHVYEKFGAYDTSFQIAADYEAILRYLVKGRIHISYIPDVMVKMRMGGESNRSIGRIFTKSQEDLRAIRRHNVGGIGTLLFKNIRKIEQFL